MAHPHHAGGEAGGGAPTQEGGGVCQGSDQVTVLLVNFSPVSSAIICLDHADSSCRQGTWDCSEAGIKLQAMDAAHVCLVAVTLEADE